MSITVDDMPTTQGKSTGRPAGLLINPVAAEHHLAGKPQTWLAKQARVSPGNLSEVLSGKKGVSEDIAGRLAEALEVPVGLLFPQLVQFNTQVRYFAAPKVA